MTYRMFDGVAALALSALLASPAVAQVPKPVQPDLGRLAGGPNERVFNRRVTTQQEGGRTVARLDARTGDGGALIEGVQVGEGVIEVDLRGKNETQGSFLGIAFHVVDWTTYDAVYFRPFNFRAVGGDQRSHSVQYVSQPVNTWQKLRAERPGQFEKAIDPPPDPNAWFHVRIVLAKSKVEVYVDRATTPSLVVDDLGEAKSGGVALWTGNGSDGAYAGLTITQTAPPGPPPVSRQTIFQAAATGNLTRLQALVEATPAAVNERMQNGLTALHLAAGNDQRPAAEFLLGKGADINAVARHAGTPLDIAYEADVPGFVRWLESKGGRFTPLKFDVSAITPTIHRVAFPWGMMNNVLVFSGTDGAIIVDSGFSTRAVDELKKVIVGFSPAGVRWVVNSHLHADHVTGNVLAPSQAAIVNAARVAAPPPGFAVTRQAEPLKGRSGRSLPIGYTWRAGGADITLIPRPGLHSDADLIVYFPKESVVAMGDLLLSESMPAVPDLNAYMSFLDDVLDVFPANTTFVSGHGRDLDLAGVRAYRDALNAMIAVVRTSLAAGRTAEQMVKDDVLKDYKAKYGLLEFLNPDTLIPRAVSALQKRKPPLALTYVANSGVLAATGESKILVDALFDKPNPAYRAPTRDVLDKMTGGAAPFDGVNLALVTHDHPDHFSAQVAVRFLESRRNAVLVAPTDAVTSMKAVATDWTAIAPRVVSIDIEIGEQAKRQVGPIAVTAFRTQHSGNRDSPVNLMYLIDLNGWRLFHEGDSPGDVEEYRRFRLGEARVELALVHWWFPLEPNRAAFLRDMLKPDHIALTHLDIEREGDVPARIDSVRKEYKDMFLLMPGMATRTF